MTFYPCSPTRMSQFYTCFVTNIFHYFDLLAIVYSAKSYFNMLFNALNGIKSDIKDKTLLYCAFQYTLSGIIK